MKTSCGSPNYAAPEVISGQLYAVPEVDVWSCGVILFALLCARLPFDDEYIPNLFKKIREGIYTIPDHVSPEARDLIASTLVVDPMKRTTIAEIREHPWFKKNLPKYLEYTPAPVDTRIISLEELDETIIRELMKKLQVTREACINNFINFNKTGKVNDLVVAYHLIYDSRKVYDTTTSNIPISTSLPVKGSISNSAIPMSPLPFGSPMINRPLFGTTPTPEKPPMTFEGEGHGLGSVNKRPARWSLGLISKQPPRLIMKEVMRVLRLINFEWKTVTPYQLRCRAVGDHLDTDRQEVKMGIQLYKLNDGNYLLDLKRLEGDIFPFLEVAQEILTEFSLSSNITLESK